MGGSVALCVRKEGVVSTRELPKFATDQITSRDFFQGRGQFWGAWQKVALEELAPIDYGLIVADFDQKWVGGIQNYSTFGFAYIRPSDRGEFNLLNTLWDEGRIEALEELGEKSRPLEKRPDEDFSAWLIRAESLKASQGLHSMRFKVSPPPGWTIEKFQDNETGWAEFLDTLVERGFELSTPALSLWEEHLREKNLRADCVGRFRSQQDADSIQEKTQATSLTSPRVRL